MMPSLSIVSFEQELLQVLPDDLPNREAVARLSARHLELIVEANRHFNLTRIVNEREAALKHVLDSVLPWRHFLNAHHVLDAGTGAGFPGIPLALVLPDVRFTLTESAGKKARFTAEAAKTLELSNVEVVCARAEETARVSRPDVITLRAVAPMPRICALFAPALKSGARALLYKGPDAQLELFEAAKEIQKHRLRARIVEKYELPDEMGTRTLVQMNGTG
jgi:16S rRNA (guanine527-N7)-methyltransferase